MRLRMDAPRAFAVTNLGSQSKFMLKNILRIQPRIALVPSSKLCSSIHSTAKSARHTARAPLIPAATPRHVNTPAATAAPSSSFLDSFSGPALSVILSTVVSALALAPSALAMDAVAYNPQDGAETLKTVAGVAYIGLVIFYFIRLFKKRADKFTSERVGSSVDDKGAATGEEDEEKDALELEAAAAAAAAEDNVTPLQCLM
jgi:hypothetical protein